MNTVEIEQYLANQQQVTDSHNLFITYSGKVLDFSNIKESDICLEDIAHHLTKICRYGGVMGFGDHYSVAQHSIILANYALHNCRDSDYSLARYLLMHDASEYLLGDVVKGLKDLLPDYLEHEESLTNLIKDKYGIDDLDDKLEKLAKNLDTRILLNESKIFVPNHYNLFVKLLKGVQPLENIQILNEQSPHIKEHIKQKFLGLCELLQIKD